MLIVNQTFEGVLLAYVAVASSAVTSPKKSRRPEPKEGPTN